MTDAWFPDVSVNQVPIDQYTISHFGWGMILGATGFTAGQTFLISLSFEWLFEPWLKKNWPEVFPAPSQDRFINSTLDTVAVMAGWAVARKKSS